MNNKVQTNSWVLIHYSSNHVCLNDIIHITKIVLHILINLLIYPSLKPRSTCLYIRKERNGQLLIL